MRFSLARPPHSLARQALAPRCARCSAGGAGVHRSRSVPAKMSFDYRFAFLPLRTKSFNYFAGKYSPLPVEVYIFPLFPTWNGCIVKAHKT